MWRGKKGAFLCELAPMKLLTGKAKKLIRGIMPRYGKKKVINGG